MADAEERFWGGAKKKREKRAPNVRADRNLARLKKAAARQVKKKGEELAETLMNKALRGDVASAKMVVGLAETKAEPDEKKPKWPRRREPSMALRLAREPQWNDLTPEQQKQSLIRSGLWDFEHDCRKGEWNRSELEEVEWEREQREKGEGGAW
jgi:hypothetical protein